MARSEAGGRAMRDRCGVLVVEVAGERHGLLAADVEAVVQAVPIVPLRAPRSRIEGVITYRGRNVAVAELRVLLGIPSKEVEHTDHLVIVAPRGQTLAVRVDRAVALVSMEMSSLDGGEHAASASVGIAGVARTSEGPLLVHDLMTVVADAEVSAGDAP